MRHKRQPRGKKENMMKQKTAPGKTRKTTKNKEKCSRTTNEMITSLENQTPKEATSTSKKQKEEPTQRDDWNNKESEPRETHQEDHEPDTLGRLIEEWMDAEDENWNKTTSPREGKRTKRTTQKN